MNEIGKFVSSVFLLSTLCLNIIRAQTLKQDSAESFFNSSIKQQSRLLNGPSFQNYASNVDGSANFQDLSGFTKGDVIYDGYRFKNIPMMYDLYEDKVISLANKTAMYSLISQKVSDFYLNNHHFKYINVIDTTKSVIKPGFFDVIFDGDLKILAKRSKKLEFALKGEEVRYYFLPKTTYYLEKGDNYTIVTSESSFMNFFKDKKNELKKHLKDNKINFKKKPEEAMILLATYYESSVH